MASSIDDTVPIAGANVTALPIRTNFFYAKQEIEELQANTAKLDQSNTFAETQTLTKSIKHTWSTSDYSATFEVNLSNPCSTVLLTGNINFNSISGITTGDFTSSILRVVQDATGSRIASFNDAVFKASLGIYPVLSTAGDAVDYLQFTAQPDGTVLVSLYANGVGSAPLETNLLLINSSGDKLLINATDKLLIE